MSRVGKAPIYFESGVQVSVGSGNIVSVKGGKYNLSYQLNSAITPKIEKGKLVLDRNSESKEVRSLHGMYRALLNNAVHGVTKGFSKTLDINGVGFKAAVQGRKLELILGYTHPITFNIPDGIEIKVEKNTKVIVSGADRQLVGAVSAKIRGYREVEPYQGKGIKYEDEHVRRKAGKTATK